MSLRRRARRAGAARTAGSPRAAQRRLLLPAILIWRALLTEDDFRRGDGEEMLQVRHLPLERHGLPCVQQLDAVHTVCSLHGVRGARGVRWAASNLKKDLEVLKGSNTDCLWYVLLPAHPPPPSPQPHA